jgi:polar amino acid transport system permease protein
MDLISQWWDALPKLLAGLRVSAELLVATVIIGSPLAVALALAQGSRLAPVRWLSFVIVEIGRGIPSLVLLYLIYFGLPQSGILLEAFVAAAIALGLNFAAYTSAVFRSGLDAVPVGQSEAAQALGLSPRVEFLRIILPQAARIVTPPMLGWVIVYFQATSMAFAIAVPELMSSAYSVASSTFQYMSIFVLAGLLYAAFSIPGSQFVAALERRRQSGLSS